VFSTAAQRAELDADKTRFQPHGSPVVSVAMHLVNASERPLPANASRAGVRRRPPSAGGRRSRPIYFGVAGSSPIGYPAIQMAVDRNRVSELLQILRPLQEKVVRLYFGLGCQRSHSASEIAREFHVSAQVIRGIIGGAERRLAEVGLTPSTLREAATFEVEISRKLEQERSVNHRTAVRRRWYRGRLG
jgi:hypothetical protein